MAEFVFHIGPHKTGSTYLQNCLCSARAELAAKGVIYPTTWQIETNHQGLPAKLKTAKDLESLCADFRLLASEDVVVLSSEDLSSLEYDSLLLLKELIGDQKARFVFYCRRWSELLYSCWQENVKQGSLETLPEYYVPRLANPFESNILNFNIVLDCYASIFGRHSIQIVSYSNLRDKKVDIFRHFVSEILDIKDANFSFPTESFPNAALGYVDIEIIRILNGLDQSFLHGRYHARHLYLEKKNEVDTRFIANQITGDCASIRIDERAPQFHSLYFLINNKYKDNLLEDEENIFVPIESQPVIYARQNYLLNDTVVREFRRLHAELRQEQ